MPITFNCPCGKTLRVPDSSAGKRARCPVCNAIASVPEPEPVFEIAEELPEPVEIPPLAPPKAYGKPRYDDDDDDKTPYGLIQPPPSSSTLDHDGQPRKKDGLPNFNKGRKNYG
ncbi:hypothetical protein J8F10_20705 [Gemmata sp. G18]|uniref:Uncharacterized protein n=1 Tax=Gemmata palustris TaxID=2822762 RepID=A0ABS5BVC9_9BACT|nr:hypothetical protein [Gemmata palustris]MBP3957678.1 hypothetical protein [Gemmata palustris]